RSPQPTSSDMNRMMLGWDPFSLAMTGSFRAENRIITRPGAPGACSALRCRSSTASAHQRPAGRSVAPARRAAPRRHSGRPRPAQVGPEEELMFGCLLVSSHALSRAAAVQPARRDRHARAGTGRSADFGGGFLDGLIDVLRAHVEFLGHVLLGLQPGLLHGLLQLALADDDQGRLPVVDDLPELRDIGPGHATPQVSAL